MASNRAKASGSRSKRHWRRAWSTHTKMNGAPTRSLTASPIHQVDHCELNELQAEACVRHRVVTPSVAPMIVLRQAASRNSEATSWRRRKAGWNPTRSNSDAPTRASTVSPMEMPIAVATAAPLLRLAAKEPSRMAGQSRRLRSTSTASAIPVSSQTTEICFCAVANCRPRRPAA